MPDPLTTQLGLFATPQIADWKSKSDPAAAFDYVLASPYWSKASNVSVLPATVLRLAIYSAAARHPDALQWAKANYALSHLAQINSAIDIVTRAFRTTDGNIARANAYIDYQKNGTGKNPLAEIPLPAALIERLAKLDPASMSLPERINLNIVKGDFAKSLDLAKTDYATANREALSRSVDRIATLLKAHDGNVLRANAYIQSQKDQKPFDLTLK